VELKLDATHGLNGRGQKMPASLDTNCHVAENWQVSARQVQALNSLQITVNKQLAGVGRLCLAHGTTVAITSRVGRWAAAPVETDLKQQSTVQRPKRIL
jgi:hypothetical protein